MQDTGSTIFLYYIVSAFDFIICCVSYFRARHCTGCTLFLSYIVSAFDFIFGSQMPFECTTHIFRCTMCPLHSAFCTCPIILELGLPTFGGRPQKLSVLAIFE